jgi:hypothetical protein
MTAPASELTAAEPERTVDLRWAEYISAHKRHLYTPAWVEHLVQELASPKGFEAATGKAPRSRPE